MNSSKIDDLSVKLIESVINAHSVAATVNNNISSLVAINAFSGSGNPLSACAAGLLSTGGRHAPITETREMLDKFLSSTNRNLILFESYLKSGKKIPGIGNSFFKDRIDPSFYEPFEIYIELWRELGNTHEETPIHSYARHANMAIRLLRSKGAEYLHPNAALITAAAASITKLPKYVENWMFISGRSNAWLKLMCKNSDT